MRLLRIALAALTAATFLGVTSQLLVPRFHCEIEKKYIDRDTDLLESLSSEPTRRSEAERVIRRINRCLRCQPSDYELYVLRAANEQLLGRRTDAVRSYEAALRLNKRPEIYTNLGILQLELGRPAAAIRNLEQATIFNIIYAETLDYSLKIQLQKNVADRHARLAGRAGKDAQ